MLSWKAGWVAAGAFLAGGLMVAEVHAQTASADTSDDDLIYLDAVSVYATRNPIDPFDYAGQVTVLDRDIILDFNPSSIGDVFAAIPNAQFDSGPRRTGDAPAIRGLSGNGVLIFLDGARQSFVSGHDGRFFVDPELVQSVEVVRGPTSALYGSGPLGGVIATRTITAQDILAPDETFGVRLNSGFQSVNDEYRVGATGVFQSPDGLVDFVGHLTYRDSGSIELGSGDLLPADDEILSSLAKLTLRPTDDLELFASFIRYNADSTDPQNPQDANIAGPGNELVFRDALSSTIQGGVRWDPVSPLLDLNLVTYYSDSSVEEDEVANPRTVDRRVETIGFTIDNRSVLQLSENTKLTLTYGGEYYRDEQKGIDTETIDGTRGGVPDATTDFIGLFVQADVTLDDLGPIPGELSLVPGIRWDDFQSSEPGGTFDINANQVSPKIGVSYKPVPELLLFGNWSRGFRAPSFNEAFADGVHFNIPNLSAPPGPFGPSFVSNLFIGNPDLESEESRTWEVGLGIDLQDVLSEGDTFRAKGSYFNSEVDNLIGLDVQTPLGCFSPALSALAPCGTGELFGNTSQNINIADANIEGFELELQYQSEYVYARGNISTINGIDRGTGAFLEGVLSPNTYFLDSGFKIESWGLRVGSRLTLASEFDEVNDPVEVRDGFFVADLYAVWRPRIQGLKGLRLDVGVDNVGDRDFEVVFAGVSQPGRNYKVALSWSRGF